MPGKVPLKSSDSFKPMWSRAYPKLWRKLICYSCITHLTLDLNLTLKRIFWDSTFYYHWSTWVHLFSDPSPSRKTSVCVWRPSVAPWSCRDSRVMRCPGLRREPCCSRRSASSDATPSSSTWSSGGSSCTGGSAARTTPERRRGIRRWVGVLINRIWQSTWCTQFLIHRPLKHVRLWFEQPRVGCWNFTRIRSNLYVLCVSNIHTFTLHEYELIFMRRWLGGRWRYSWVKQQPSQRPLFNTVSVICKHEATGYFWHDAGTV